MPIYTFHLRRSDEVATGLDVLDLDHDATAFQKAGELLEDHLSCDHVEVWEGERPLVSRHREQPIIRPVQSDPAPLRGRRPMPRAEGHGPPSNTP